MATRRPRVATMNTEHEAPLALELAQLANRLDADENRQTGELEDPQRLLRSVERFGELARISADLQAQAVRSAHEAGISWAMIGAHLGISRQAVQQRFDPSYHHDEPIPEQTRVLGPVSRAEEVEHLNAAAAEGWRPIRSLRSEEHTSELQSRGHLVCRLLLEKKKDNRKAPDNHTTD